LLLVAGSLGDRFGRKWALLVGLAVFNLGSILSAFAGSPEVLIGTRALMGVGGALVMPATLSILTNVFVESREREKAIGIWAGVVGVGVAVGPIAGGLLLQHFWWGSVFLINVPIVAAGIVAAAFLVPNSADPNVPRLDPVGSALSIAGLCVLLWGIIEAPTTGWGSTRVLAGMAGGIVIIVAFLAWELHADHPMLNLGFFRTGGSVRRARPYRWWSSPSSACCSWRPSTSSSCSVTRPRGGCSVHPCGWHAPAGRATVDGPRASARYQGGGGRRPGDGGSWGWLGWPRSRTGRRT